MKAHAFKFNFYCGGESTTSILDIFIKYLQISLIEK